MGSAGLWFRMVVLELKDLRRGGKFSVGLNTNRFSRRETAGIPRRPLLDRVLPNPKLKLLDQCREVLRVRATVLN
jgi:hypothetical protein